MNPAPVVEFGLIALVETEIVFVAKQAQEIPALFLADAEWLAIAANISFGETIAEPSLGTTQDLNLMRPQSHLLLQLAEQRILRGLVIVYAALGKLPGILTYTTPPKEFALTIAEDYADIEPETV